MSRLDSSDTPALKPLDLSRRFSYPPALFEQVTDILADLVLEDLRQYPKVSARPRIDRFNGRENTSLPTQASGGADWRTT